PARCLGYAGWTSSYRRQRSYISVAQQRKSHGERPEIDLPPQMTIYGSMSPQSESAPTPGWHATTILSVRKGGQVVMAGDGQVSMGQTIVKANAKKVRRLGNGSIVGGFAGSTADAFTLFERLEAKLERYPGQLLRACIELAKDWRTDRY